MDLSVTLVLVLALSLVVGVSLAVSHARAGRVRWRTGLMIGAAGLTGAFLGGLLGGLLGGHRPGAVLLVAFALMMVATSIAMIRGRRSVDEAKRHGELPVARVLVQQAPPDFAVPVVGALALLGLAAGACWAFVESCPLRTTLGQAA